MQAKRLGLARIVAVSFLLADKLFGTALLVQLGVQGDPVVDALAQRILRRIITDGGFDPESVGYFRLMMDLRERLRDRVSFLWRLWATPGAGEWSAIRLPSSLFPLYRVVRMFRLAGQVLSGSPRTTQTRTPRKDGRAMLAGKPLRSLAPPCARGVSFYACGGATLTARPSQVSNVCASR